MTRVGGHVEFGGWTVRLQSQVIPEERGYDQPAATYSGTTVYDSASTAWVTLDCQLMSVTAGHGGRVEQIPGVRASLGTLSAQLYDPLRVLDPKVSPYSLLARPGAPVRLVAIAPETGTTRLLWTGETTDFTHDLLTGQGTLEAQDLVARYAGTSTVEWARPAEASSVRYAAINALLTQPLPVTFDGPDRAVCAAKIAGDVWSAGVLPVAETEQSIVWVDQGGTLRRRDLDSGWGAMTVCGDCDTGAEHLIYTRLTSTVTDDLLTNLVLAERLSIGDADRPLRQRQNVQSINWYGARSLTETQVQAVDDTGLAWWMQRVLDLRATPRPTVTGMGITISDLFPWTPGMMVSVVGLTVGDALDIRLTSRITPSRWLAVVAGISHSITPDAWEIELELADGTPALSVSYGYDQPESTYNVSTYDVTRIPIPAGV